MTPRVFSPPAECETGEPAIFLAGGISGCNDWQSEFIASWDAPHTLFNPRRANFSMEDPNAAAEQIAWEHRHLERASAVLFWFTDATIQPITLFELGRWSGRRDRPIFVGAHPNYARRQDILFQLKLERPELIVSDSLEALRDQVLRWSQNLK